mgnify:CR=1 FL=1
MKQIGNDERKIDKSDKGIENDQREQGQKEEQIVAALDSFSTLLLNACCLVGGAPPTKQHYDASVAT